jgi:hypothetical protein
MRELAVMNKETNWLKTLRVASPCHESWERMAGDERVRMCDACHLHVYNFSEMTAGEIRSLITRTEGRLCGRLYRRSDGTIVTKDCPVGLRALQRKVSRVAGAAFATILSACSFVFAQNPKKDGDCKQIPSVTLDRKKTHDNQSPTFGGTVLDVVGAVIPGASVNLLDTAGRSIAETKTNDKGEFSFVGLPEGKYSINTTAAGFKTLKLTEVDLHSTEVATARFVLEVDQTMVVVGVMAAPPDLDSINGTTRIPGSFIRKLPINR